ncbi:YerC/YecD family TrpR-related protein [Clostridium sp. MT-14]|jgi:TrpR-related protein YerC/YecD|uniref:YerC/YecD family TrpR-related protein n=1 Tax=Clostridium aromativorans TaxID=2836848 RepID=A0ABS8N3L1_9CLOT|nr:MULTISPECIES: YerC/YecD family TrpR-related protein [Clostridium]KAA8664637.1 TrpR-like protein YerC/YecD [Clostridium sp. HV4-5-A1G]MCC9294400.1 YerC/YecD family TrpR-related protein [Clostridium aromativorans]CAB1262349.1 transcriptional repressor - histidine operons [Clostridiaceae bacterium BL-3]
MGEYRSKLESKQMDYLCEAVLCLKTKEECYRFFDDICTINEIKSLEQRLQVAKMLSNKKTYLDIAAATGASTATISRVNRCLNYGSDGYKIVLGRLK